MSRLPTPTGHHTNYEYDIYEFTWKKNACDDLEANKWDSLFFFFF